MEHPKVEQIFQEIKNSEEKEHPYLLTMFVDSVDASFLKMHYPVLSKNKAFVKAMRTVKSALSGELGVDANEILSNRFNRIREIIENKDTPEWLVCFCNKVEKDRDVVNS